MEKKLGLALISSEQETSLMQLPQALRKDNSCHSVYSLSSERHLLPASATREQYTRAAHQQFFSTSI
jgi:hypothetical protein